MAFNKIYVLRRQAGDGISAAHGTNLAFTIRSQKIAPHVVGKTDTSNQSIDIVLITQGIIEPL